MASFGSRPLRDVLRAEGPHVVASAVGPWLLHDWAAGVPASAAALAVLVLGERMTVALAVGFGLMFASILVATWPRRRA